MGIKKNVVKQSEMPRNIISEALALNEGEAIIIPVEERRKVLAGLHYYTSRSKSHEGWKFVTKAHPEQGGMVFLLRDKVAKKAKAAMKKKPANSPARRSRRGALSRQ
jgi:hypothetical protein